MRIELTTLGLLDPRSNQLSYEGTSKTHVHPQPARGFEPRIFSLQVRCVTTAPYGLVLAQAVAEFYNVEKWSAIFCCNNKRALELSLQHRCRIRPSAKCTNIRQNLHAIKQYLYRCLQIHPRIQPHGSIPGVGTASAYSATQLWM